MTAEIDHSQLPSTAHAKLPASYEAAKNALSECSRIDECQQWADKAEALASYAKQAKDDQLRKMADRIQARAIRRCGELLKQVDGKGARTDLPDKGAHTKLTQRQAAESAGMSRHQQVQATRVASVPEEDFNAAVEGDSPPTVTQLAEQGKKSRVVDLGEAKPENFAAATQAIGHLREFAKFARASNPETIAAGIQDQERGKVRQYIETIDSWLDQLITRI